MADPIFPRTGVDPESVGAWLTDQELVVRLSFILGMRRGEDSAEAQGFTALAASRREVHSLRAEVERLTGLGLDIVANEWRLRVDDIQRQLVEARAEVASLRARLAPKESP